MNARWSVTGVVLVAMWSVGCGGDVVAGGEGGAAATGGRGGAGGQGGAAQVVACDQGTLNVQEGDLCEDPGDICDSAGATMGPTPCFASCDPELLEWRMYCYQCPASRPAQGDPCDPVVNRTDHGGTCTYLPDNTCGPGSSSDLACDEASSSWQEVDIVDC